MIDKVKHWYYFGEPVSKSGRVRCACGFYGSLKTEIDVQNPTCEVCKKSKEEFDNEYEEGNG